MGGNAFPDINIPRLSQSEYEYSQKHCVAIVQRFYKQIECPPEGPEKTTHGDVDLLVSQPEAREHNVAALAEALGATQVKQSRSIMNFAIPLGNKAETFVQVDIHLCDPEYLQWELWLAGFGDLCQIIGMLVRPIGLTMNTKGLHVRVPEMESSDRKASMILLSADPLTVMDFLGHNAEQYRQGFSTLDQVYEWCSAGRFYHKPRLAELENNKDDRTRLKKRPMFSRFMNVWLPANPGACDNQDRWPRDKVLAEAIDYFKNRADYDAIISLWRHQARQQQALESIRSAINEITTDDKGQKIGKMCSSRVFRGCKRWTIFENGNFLLRPENDDEDIQRPPDWLGVLSDDELEELLLWIKSNYAELDNRERDRIKAKMKFSGPALDRDGPKITR